MSLAKSYSKALFETAVERGLSREAIDVLGVQLQGFAGMVKDRKDLKQVLCSAATKTSEKVKVVEALTEKLNSEGLLRQFLTLLAQNERLSWLSEMSAAYEEAALTAQGKILGRLVSAEAMTDLDIQSVAQSFEKKLGKKVAFRTSVDPDLLAGIKVEVSGVTYDGSLRAQLRRLKDQVVLSQ